MQELEKILEEIDIEKTKYRDAEDAGYRCGLDKAKSIIRKHMNDSQRKDTFEFDFTGVKSFDCQCGRHYVNTEGDGWIPVEERPPERCGKWQGDSYEVTIVRGGRYLVTTTAYDFANCKWVTRERVIAWRPLPEPYRPERRTSDD